MSKKKLDKHYRISEELCNKIQETSGDKFSTEVQAIEYYLEKGIQYEYLELYRDNFNDNLNYCIKEILYIKTLLEQLFANKNFANNRDIKKDESLKEFKNKLRNDKFIK